MKKNTQKPLTKPDVDDAGETQGCGNAMFLSLYVVWVLRAVVLGGFKWF